MTYYTTEEKKAIAPAVKAVLTKHGLKGMIDGILRKCGSITTINEVRDSMLGGLNYNDY